LVEDGDTIEIDLQRRVCNLLVDDAQLAQRRDAWRKPAPVNDTGWLRVYRATVGTMPQGAILTAGKPAAER
jgi:dihydroxy-acid dehydratase